MSKFLLQTKSEVGPLYWGGDGWWTRRKDQAKRFDTAAEATREREENITIRIASEEPAEAE
mgnify:CR=1 FL=1